MDAGVQRIKKTFNSSELVPHFREFRELPDVKEVLIFSTRTHVYLQMLMVKIEGKGTVELLILSKYSIDIKHRI